MESFHPFFCLFLIIFVNISLVQSDLQFCQNGLKNYSSSYNENNSLGLNCPYGILFEEPLILAAIGSEDSEFCLQKDICTNEPWECATYLQYSKAQLIISQKPNEQWKIVTSDATVDRTIPNCIDSESEQNTLETGYEENPLLNRKKRQAVLIPIEEDQSRFLNSQIMSAVDEQTKRLFYFLSEINYEKVNSNIRVIQLFHAAIRLVHMICDAKYLREEFLDNVEKAFLFMLKEEGTERITDVDADDFILLRRALEHCMADPSGNIEFDGNHCPADFHVDSVSRNGKVLKFNKTDESNFVWGSFDVTIDAAWHVIDIVHGMCFATFRENLNLHHKFQVVMEQLFRNSNYMRWNRVTKLKKDSEYDNMFMAPVNTTMEVLDACAMGAYIGSPFLHRLKRPIMEASRKKRSIEDQYSMEVTPDKVGYCLKTEEEQKKMVGNLKKKQC